MAGRYMLIIIALSVLLASGVTAQEIEWTAQAKSDYKEIPAALTSTFGGVGLSGQSRMSYLNDVTVLKTLFPRAEVDDTQRTLHYHKGAALKGRARRSDVIGSYKQKALSFVHNTFPHTIHAGESVEVLVVEEDYGADQEKDINTGEISPLVNVKTYSYNVRIGRRLHGHPIFNSFASVEIDTATDEIVSFKFHNWAPVSIEQKDFSSLTRQRIYDSVNARLRSQLPEDDKTGISKFRVDSVLSGWLFDDKNGEVVPSFVHSGVVYVTDNVSGAQKEKRYAFVERLDNNASDDLPLVPNAAAPAHVQKPEVTPEYPMKKQLQ